MTRITLRLLAIAALVLFAQGCKPEDSASNASVGGAADGQTAQLIWQDTLDAYSAASTYQDNAKLYLSYRMAGQYIQEEQPWSLAFRRGTGRGDEQIAADWFNSEIRSNGKRTSCFVYDNESGNLDQQWLLIDEAGTKGMSRLLNDSIARHFSAGFSEVPLNDAPDARIDRLVPPVLGWLTNSMEWPQLRASSQVVRLDDAKVDGAPCYHLQVGQTRDIFDLWIDQESHFVRQMTLPSTLLDPFVLKSDEVNEIQFFARMHNATFSKEPSNDAFALKMPKDAVPVQQFVTIPEAFPCESIGKPLPSLRLFDQQGQQFDLAPQQGETINLVWISNLTGSDLLRRLNLLKENTPDECKLFLIFDDSQIDPDSPNKVRVHSSIDQAAKSLGLSPTWLYDQQLGSADTLGLVSLPAVVIVGGDGKVEFATNMIEDGWEDEAAAATERTIRGDHVSEEMNADYQQYVERYKKKLQLVSASKLAKADNNPSEVHLNSNNNFLTANRLWRNFEFKRPGNLYSNNSGNGVWMLDGWRTVSLISSEGNEIKRFELDLPTGEGVNLLRFSSDPDGTRCAFSKFGHSAFLYDSEWKPIATISSNENRQIADCAFANRNGETVLLVGYSPSGSEIFAANGDSLWQNDQLTLEGLVATTSHLLALSSGTQGSLHESNSQMAFEPWDSKNNTIVRMARGNSIPSIAVQIAIDPNATWICRAISADGQILMEEVVGSQMFESAIEPLLQIGVDTDTLVASADTFGIVHLLSVKRGYLGRLETDFGLTGLELLSTPNGIILLTSSPRGVAAWELPADLTAN
ncbi:MAG: DUF2092 domain-containing protein [Pirellulaceae bacterium]